MADTTEKLKNMYFLLNLLVEKYGLWDKWYINGCSHGYTPAYTCPLGDECGDALEHRLWIESPHDYSEIEAVVDP